MSEEDLKNYIEAERAKKTPDSDIRQALVRSGWDPILAHRALLSAGGVSVAAEVSDKSAPAHEKISNWFLIIGILCIIVAVITFISLGWPSLSPLARFFVVAVPNFLLLIIGTFFAKAPALKNIKDGTQATGLLILPATLGVFLYQFGFYANVDGMLVFLSTACCLPVYLYFSLVKQRYYAPLLVLVGSIIAFIGLISDPQPSAMLKAAIASLFGVMFVTLATSLKHRQEEHFSIALESASTIMFMFGLPQLVAEFASTTLGLDQDLTSLMTSLIAGLTLLVVGVLYGRLLQPVTKTEVFAQRSMFVLALLVIFLSLFGMTDNQPVYAAIGVFLATLIVFLGLSYSVKLLFVGGLVGGAMSLLSFFLDTLDSISALIGLLTIGFVAIVTSILVAKRQLGHNALAHPEAGERLGFISDERAHSSPRPNVSADPSPGMIILRVVLVIVAFYVVQYIMIMMLTGSAPSEPGSYSSDAHYL